MNQANNTVHMYRASILHFPLATESPDTQFALFEDGALVVENEKIVAIGDYLKLHSLFDDANIVDYSGRWLIPGLIDSHLHFPQTEMIAKYGKQLLDWLENFTFPTENKFASAEYCDYIAEIFIRQLIDNGTTTALAYPTVHSQSVDALFKAASARNMAIVTGKVCMDRNCPEQLQDTPESAQRESANLIQKWHGKHRNLYALTPRFAPTSSPAQLHALGELAQQFQDVFIQTHLSENTQEVEWVAKLYPEHTSYLNVYEHYNMVRERSVFGHCLHLQEDEWAQLGESGATAAFCPTSNLFLGSGLFDIAAAKRHNVAIVLATDIGGGTSFNMLRTYGEAYKVSQLQNSPISPLLGLYMMTQGPAHAYGLTNSVGNLNIGTYADFIILNQHFNALAYVRNKEANKIDDLIFALSMIGDERAIKATYIAGKQYKGA